MEGQALYSTFLKAIDALESSGFYALIAQRGGSRTAKGEREWIENVRQG